MCVFVCVFVCVCVYVCVLRADACGSDLGRQQYENTILGPYSRQIDLIRAAVRPAVAPPSPFPLPNAHPLGERFLGHVCVVVRVCSPHFDASSEGGRRYKRAS
jgi:hypothetical protein